MKMLRLGLLPMLCLAFSSVLAGQYNEKLKIGDAAPIWKDLPGVDGKKHSLSDLKDTPVVVVVFTCSSCPTAVNYEARIQSLQLKYGDKLKVVAVGVNHESEDQLPAITAHAKEEKFAFQYIYDASQNLAKMYGAKYTPEFFVLNADRKIVYMGAMDDKNDPKMVTKNHLDSAIKSVLAGEKLETTETQARGCLIRFLRPKRTDDD